MTEEAALTTNNTSKQLKEAIKELIRLEADDSYSFDKSTAVNYLTQIELIEKHRDEILAKTNFWLSDFSISRDMFYQLEKKITNQPEEYKRLLTCTGLAYLYSINFFIAMSPEEEYCFRMEKERAIQDFFDSIEERDSGYCKFLGEKHEDYVLNSKRRVFREIIEYKINQIDPMKYYCNLGMLELNILRTQLKEASLVSQQRRKPLCYIFSDPFITLHQINDKYEPIVTPDIIEIFKYHGYRFEDIKTLPLNAMINEILEGYTSTDHLLIEDSELESSCTRDNFKGNADTLTNPCKPKGVGLLDAAMVFHDHDLEVAKAAKNRYLRAKDLPEPIGVDPSHSQRKLYEPAALLQYLKEKESYIPYEEKQFLQRLNDLARLPK